MNEKLLFNHEMNSKNTICWNIAISQASLNVYSMEANSAIARWKRDINHLHRRYLAGKAQMEKQFKDESFDDDLWKTRTDDALSKNKKKHEQKIENMTNNYKKKIQELKKGMPENEQKISYFQKIINESNSILKNHVPNIDFDVIGDLDDLKKAIENENQIIKSLENLQSQDS